MVEDPFRSSLLDYFDELKDRVVTKDGDWTVKGFIDIYRRIYTISVDSKVLSKVLELLMFPVLQQFAQRNGFRVILAQAQNQYPDLTLVSTSNENLCFAVDIKTTYRTKVDQDGLMRVNGMTLGTFGGYFRNRDRPVNSVMAYARYAKHYVLGVVYSRAENIDERQVYEIEHLTDIPSVASDFQFFLHEKYRIASDGPGSGNTKNIGSTKYLDRLLNGTGVFAKLGEAVFNDYWMNYRTRSMAKDDGFEAPLYINLRTYHEFKKRGSQILEIPVEDVETEVDDESSAVDEG